jgi:hypothetical protein
VFEILYIGSQKEFHMRFMIPALVVVSLVFQAALLHARTYDVEAVGEYVMGDSDTK